MYIEAVALSCALFLHHKYSLQWMKAVLDYYNAKPNAGNPHLEVH